MGTTFCLLSRNNNLQPQFPDPVCTVPASPRCIFTAVMVTQVTYIQFLFIVEDTYLGKTDRIWKLMTSLQ